MPGRRGLQICSVLKKEENPCFASGNYYYYYYYYYITTTTTTTITTTTTTITISKGPIRSNPPVDEPQ